MRTAGLATGCGHPGQRYSSPEAARSALLLKGATGTVVEYPDHHAHLVKPGPGAPGAPQKSAPKSRSGGPGTLTREAVYGRDQWCCVRCGRWCKEIPHSLHHRKQRSLRGTHDPENLILLCGSGTTDCHGYVHEHITEAEASGWLVCAGDDPALVSVLVISEHGSGLSMWLTADGERTDVAPDGAP